MFIVFTCISFVMVIRLVREMWGLAKKVLFWRNLFLSSCRFLFNFVSVVVSILGVIGLFMNIGNINWWVGR